ncbi:tyrosine-type recombinase/integrase [Domibacillus epiphyticus]|uniref:Site-specific integrase n=1 Tax=Domibacillus epiphyticus TaxID=1714355 RepID=A0A1V2AB91_9BACI|nr:tyrosine-type recombinase/integrase [Domibacillus epiphyticus]OMP68230.1 site-specific integrase [Domibacillus epiphyticus]
MEYVNPIKNIEKIQLIKEILKKQSSRDFVLFVLGINTGLKISTLLSLKINQLVDENGEIHSFLQIDNQCVYLNDQVKAALQLHLNHSTPPVDSYLFKSPKSESPISRQQAYRVINEAARKAGIRDQIGTHTLRKTFGYHAYIKGVAISLIQERFHHASPSETFRYIGMDETKQKIDVNL